MTRVHSSYSVLELGTRHAVCSSGCHHTKLGTGKMVQWVKVAAYKPDDLSLIFENLHKGGRRKWTPQSCSVIIHMCTAYITTHTCHTHIMYSNSKIPSWYVDRITILLRHALIHRLSRLTLNSVGNWEWCWAPDPAVPTWGVTGMHHHTPFM